MDGLFHGKPELKLGWFGGCFPPLFLVQHPYIHLQMVPNNQKVMFNRQSFRPQNPKRKTSGMPGRHFEIQQTILFYRCFYDGHHEQKSGKFLEIWKFLQKKNRQRNPYLLRICLRCLGLRYIWRVQIPNLSSCLGCLGHGPICSCIGSIRRNRFVNQIPTGFGSLDFFG